MPIGQCISQGAALEGREAPRLVTEANPTQLQTPNRIEEDKKVGLRSVKGDVHTQSW